MRAFHGDAAIKAKFLARVEAHRKADEIVQGYYWQAGKGCAVGCTVHSSSHAAFETELGIPRTLARLEDQIFERLDNATAKEWPEQFLSAPAVGADLSMVWPRFALWLLSNPYGPVVMAAMKIAPVKAAVECVAALYQEWVSTGAKPAKARWSAAYAAAAAADAAAAYAAYAAQKTKWQWIYATYRHARGPEGLLFDPAWRTTTAVSLATGIVTDRAFDRMPYLADALQDAGCDDGELLAHLQGDAGEMTAADFVLWNLLGYGEDVT